MRLLFLLRGTDQSELRLIICFSIHKPTTRKLRIEISHFKLTEARVTWPGLCNLFVIYRYELIKLSVSDRLVLLTAKPQ